MFTGAIPAHRPKLPADLESDNGLAGAGGHRQERAALPGEDRLEGPTDGDLLIVAGRLAAEVVRRGQQTVGSFP
jgi:hypothetical protein